MKALKTAFKELFKVKYLSSRTGWRGESSYIISHDLPVKVNLCTLYNINR